MKSYLGLVPQYEKVHRKNNRISVLCIVLSVLLVTAIFSMADMAIDDASIFMLRAFREGMFIGNGTPIPVSRYTDAS